MSLLEKLLSDTGDASSKRAVLLMGGSSLSLAVVGLACAAWCGYDVSSELNAVSYPLALLGGGSYVGGKMAEGKANV